MPRVKVSTKGQIVLPARLRRRYKIRPGDEVLVQEGAGGILVAPALKDPVKEGRGILPRGPSLTEDLVEDHRLEVERERAADPR
jgi:AbrB family looped-hinge helix DNA binding protein